MINQVTYVPELQIIATCSFDCNVKMWRAYPCGIEQESCKCIKKCGSLKLGTRDIKGLDVTEAERRENEKVW